MISIVNQIFLMRAWKQFLNMITVTSHQYLSRVTVLNIHDIRSHEMETNAVHDILRFRFQR